MTRGGTGCFVRGPEGQLIPVRLASLPNHVASF